MRKLGLSLCSVAVVLAATLLSPNAQAEGLVLTATSVYHPSRTSVSVEIVEEVASTSAELEFTSAVGSDRRFLFPVPESASVVGFSIFRNGAWAPAELTGKEATTPGQVGSSQGGSLMTPALRAYLGDNSFIITLPEEEGESVRVKLDYIQILPYEFGEVSYLYPLQDYAGSSGGDRDLFRLSLDVTSLRPIAGYQATGFGSLATVEEESPGRLVVRYQAESFAPPGDFPFSYAVVQDAQLYVNLLTDHEACGEDGFYLLVVEPKQDVDETQVIPKYFTFVMDNSGSMSGHKIDQAKEAALFFVQNLNEQDRFNVITFSTYVDPLFPSPEGVTQATQDQASSFIKSKYADSSTDLHQALLTGLNSDFDSSFARILVLLTDGQPTSGVTHSPTLLADVKKANTSHTRIFPFGIGADVNKSLLLALAEANNGEATFLGENDQISKTLAGFYQKIDRPVLTDATINYGGIPTYDAFPDGEIDLFAGAALLVVGRYRAGGEVEGSLSGSKLGNTESYAFPLSFPECALNANAFLPRLWAKSKIDALIAQMEEQGREDAATIEQIRGLAEKYGIQTPWTSYEVGNDPAPSGGTGGRGGNNGYGNGYGYGGTGSASNYPSYQSGGLEISGCQMGGGNTSSSLPLGLLGLGLLARLRRRRG